MKITGGSGLTFRDGQEVPVVSNVTTSPADGSMKIGLNYVDPTCSMYIVSGHQNSVGANCKNVTIINSSGCVITAGVQDAIILNSSGVTVMATGVIVINKQGGTYSTNNAAIVDLTDNSGGTATNTIDVITDNANIGSADVVPTQDAIADLAGKVNEILTAIRRFGII